MKADHWATKYVTLQYGYLFSGFALGLFMTISTALTSISAALLLIVFFFSGHYREKITLLKRFYVWPFIVLLLLGVISAIYSPAGFYHGIQWAGKLYKFLIVWVIAYACYRYPSITTKLLCAFFIGVIINVIAIYINYYFLTPATAIQFSGANFPTAGSHILSGFTFAITGFMLLMMAIKTPSLKLKILLSLLGLVTICAELGLNASRTGYIIEFAIVVVGFFMKFRYKGLIAAIIAVPMIFVTFYHFSPIFKTRVDQAYVNTVSYYAGNNTNTSAGVRLGFYHTALSMFAHDPVRLLYGYGTGAQRQSSEHFIDQNITTQDHKFYQVINNPHNQYIYFLMQSGIWALGLFVWLLAALFYYAKDLPVMIKNNARILVIAIAIGCFFNSWLLDVAQTFVFCFLIPVLFTTVRPLKQASQSSGN